MCIVCIANNINRNVYMYLNTCIFPTTGYTRVLLFMFIRRELGRTGTGCLFQFTYCAIARRCFRQTGSVYALRINLLNIMLKKTLLRGCGTSIIMKLNESNKEVKIQKNIEKKIRGFELRTFWL